MATRIQKAVFGFTQLSRVARSAATFANSQSIYWHTSSKQSTFPCVTNSRQRAVWRQYSTCQTVAEVRTGGQKLEFNTLWLRENCQCSECFNHSTNQRNVLYYLLSDAQTSVRSQEIKDDTFEVTWNDGHISSYPLQWLEEHTPGGAPEYVDRFLWDNKSLSDENIHNVPYEEFMNTEVGLKKLLGNLLKYGFGVVQGARADTDGTQTVTDRVCHIQETLFGKMWSFTADMARGDTAYTNIALGAHTDTTYLQLPAGIQVFHVLHHDGEGGETLLVDGFRAAETLRRNNPAAFHLLKTTRVHHRYIEPGHYTRSLDPVLVTDPVTDTLINIRYNHYDRAPITTIPHHQLGRYYDALAELSAQVTDSEGEHWVKLQPGMVLFVDNFRVLHGRAAFTGYRRVCGCYLPRDDWIGKARVMGLTW